MSNITTRSVKTPTADFNTKRVFDVWMQPPSAGWCKTSGRLVGENKVFPVSPDRISRVANAKANAASINSSPQFSRHQLTLTGFLLVVSNHHKIVSQSRHVCCLSRGMPTQFSIFPASKEQPCLTEGVSLRLRAGSGIHPWAWALRFTNTALYPQHSLLLDPRKGFFEVHDSQTNLQPPREK